MAIAVVPPSISRARLRACFFERALHHFSDPENAARHAPRSRSGAARLGSEYPMIIGGSALKPPSKFVPSIRPRPAQTVGIHQKAGGSAGGCGYVCRAPRLRF